MSIYLIGFIFTSLAFAFVFGFTPPNPIENSHIKGAIIVSLLWFIMVPVLIGYMIGVSFRFKLKK